MRSKSALAVVCAAAMAMSFSGCGGTPSGSELNDFHSSSVKMESQVSTAQTESSKLSGSSSHSSSESIPVIEPTDFGKTAEISETVLYDQNNVKITATALTYNRYDAELKLNIENNSLKDLKFLSGTLGYSCNSVNGYMVDMGYLNCEVAAGKKANDKIKLSYSSLQIYGINEIADIEIGFDIDAADIFDRDFEEIYTGPCAVKTSAAKDYDYSKDTFREGLSNSTVQNKFGITLDYIAEDKIFDSNGISVISEVFVANKDGDKIMFLEVVNGTSEQLVIQTSDITLNGLKLHGANYSNDRINAGKRCIVDISFDNILDRQYWEVCGLSAVNSAGLSLKAMKNDRKTEICSASLTVTANGSETMFNPNGAEVYNKNGVRIVSKGIFGGERDYDEDFYLLMIVENFSGKSLIINDEYNSLSVNGYMTDYFCGAAELGGGETATLKMRLDGDSLSDNKIEDISGIHDIEFTVKVRGIDYKEIDKSVVKITF